MDKRIKILLLLIFGWGFTACYEDEGNYDYTPLPDTKVAGIEESYTITQFDTLKIVPDIQLESGDESDYEYSWRMWADIWNAKTIILGNEKNLVYRVTDAPATYILKYTVLDKRTGTKTYRESKLIVQGNFTESWLVLHEKDGKTDFDVISSPFFMNRVSKDVHQRSVYEMSNGEVLPGKGVQIASYYYPYNQYIYVLTDQTGVRLSIVTMQKEYDFSAILLGNPEIKPEGYAYMHNGSRNAGGQVIICDGIYYMTGYGGWQMTPPVLRDGEIYRAAPFCPKKVKWEMSSVIYDELQGRFLQVLNQMYTVQAFPPATGALFDWNHMNAKMLYMEEGFNNYEYAVMKDHTSGKKKLFVLNFKSEDNQYAQAMYDMSNCPEIDAAECYTVGSRGNVFYYGIGRNVYFYDYSGTNTADIYLEMPEHEIITSLKILKPNEGYYLTNHPYDNKVLMIATYNEQTHAGKVYMYYINEANGLIDKSSEKVFEGLGKVIDMAYSYAKWGA